MLNVDFVLSATATNNNNNNNNTLNANPDDNTLKANSALCKHTTIKRNA